MKIPINMVCANSEQKRLDVFLCELSGFSRSAIQKSIKKNLIFVNEKIISKAGFILEINDCITGFIEDFHHQNGLKPENIPLKVIFEDSDLIVIDKPPNLVVHPTNSLREGTLVNALLYRYQNNLSDHNNSDGFRPGIVHRLDKDTSGLMIIAKTNFAHIHLSEQLKSRSLKRTYWTIVHGSFKEFDGIIEAPIGRHPNDRKKMAVIKDEKSKSRFARTHWSVIKIQNDLSLLEVKLDTGRTHQIRVHLAHINRPILGDEVYGIKTKYEKLIQRQCLHAKKIQSIHPKTNQSIELESELAEDFQNILDKIFL